MEEEKNLILQINNLSKNFGGIKAVNDITFEVVTGEHLGVIGPNGAGKTTLFNLISGNLSTDRGEVIYQGKNITNLPARKRSLAGISRTFQTSQLFLELTVLENLFLAANKNQNTYNLFSPWRKDEDVKEESIEMADKLGLDSFLQVKAKQLAHGKRRLLGIGQALVAGANLLMLDEPAAGLPSQEREEISELIKELTKNLTLIIIDHDMDIIFDIADRVLVLNEGKILAIDTPEAIKENEEVQKIYVGGE